MTTDARRRRPVAARLGRPARLLVVVALVAGLVVVPFARGGSAAQGPPSTFDIRVSAAPVVGELDAITVLPLPLDNGVARTSVAMNSQPLVIAQAAVAYSPVAETVLAANPEVGQAAYCYSYFPSGPGNPEEARCGGASVLPGDLGADAGSGHTATTGDENDPTSLRSRASARAVGIGGAGPAASLPLAIGQAASTSESGAVDAAMTATASAAVSDIDVAGVLTIRAVRSFVNGGLTGEPGGVAAERGLTIEGATVLGQAVEIDETGVHAIGQPAVPLPTGDAQDAVNSALERVGINVAIAPAPEPEVSDDGTRLHMSSGTLRITFVNLDAGILSRYDIGGTQLTMQARQRTVFAPPPTVEQDEPASGVTPSAAPTSPSVASSQARPPTPPRLPAVPEAGTDAGSPVRETFQVALGSSPISHWDLPYPAFALLVLAIPIVFNARRLTVVRR